MRPLRALSPMHRALVPVPIHAELVRVVVIEEHPVTRIGLVAVLQAERDMMVVGAASDLRSGLDLVGRWSPDAVLIDPDLRESDGPSSISALRARARALRIIAVGQHEGDEEIHRILEAGAFSYVLKSAPPAEIITALHQASDERRWLSPSVRQRLEERRKWPELTPRERQVLALVAEGRSNASIAAVLGIASGTVKLHIKSIFAKLGVEDRAQAALVALRRGFARIG